MIINGTTFSVDDLRREHAVPVSGLNLSAPYAAAVQSTDDDGNGPATASVDFTTTATPDTAAPLFIEGPLVTGITYNSAMVEWRTDEPATTLPDHGLAQDLSQQVSEAGLQVIHQIELTQLTPGSTYSVRSSATDTADNGPALSPVVQFTTLSAPDASPPIILNGPMVIDIAATKSHGRLGHGRAGRQRRLAESGRAISGVPRRKPDHSTRDPRHRSESIDCV